MEKRKREYVDLDHVEKALTAMEAHLYPKPKHSWNPRQQKALNSALLILPCVVLIFLIVPLPPIWRAAATLLLILVISVLSLQSLILLRQDFLDTGPLYGNTRTRVSLMAQPELSPAYECTLLEITLAYDQISSEVRSTKQILALVPVVLSIVMGLSKWVVGSPTNINFWILAGLLLVAFVGGALLLVPDLWKKEFALQFLSHVKRVKEVEVQQPDEADASGESGIKLHQDQSAPQAPQSEDSSQPAG